MTDLIIWIVVGAIGGFLASFFVKLAWGGLLGSIITGIVGGLLAGWLGGLLGINAGVSGFNLVSIVTAFVGAIILSVIVGWISARR
jgi:uncharacterized membrane protein YeaQ/YmgE (transglycosylase-associated protein family)